MPRRLRPHFGAGLFLVAMLSVLPVEHASAAPAIPQAPTLVSITGLPIVNAKMRITWTLVPDATDYVVWTSPNPGTGPYQPLYRAFGIVSVIDIIDMPLRNPWYFTITAENSSGVSPRSNEIASAFPYGAPLFYSNAPTIGDQSLGIHWLGNSFWVSYTVHWGTTSGVYSGLADLVQNDPADYTIRGLTNGTRYYFKVTAIDENGASWAANESSAVPGLATTLAASPASVTTGATVAATWTALAQPSRADWIGLYANSAAGESQFVAWRYTDGTAAGSVPLAIPFGMAPGTTYELRLFAGNSYTRLARSGPFAIKSGVAPALSVPSGTYAAGGSLTASWSGVPSPSATDWIGLYPLSTSSDTSYLGWRYTTGTTSGSASVTLPAGLPNGATYELRLFSNNTSTRLATSSPITIGGPAPTTVAVSAGSVPAGGSPAVSWSGVASPTATDWIGLYATSTASDGAYVAWRYTAGNASGTASFAIPFSTTPGTSYEFRLFSNNGFTRLATSASFAVTTAAPPALAIGTTTPTAGLAMTVSWTGIPSASSTDWIGLYSSGAADTAYLGWSYTTGVTAGSLSFTIPTTVNPGSGYELRLFSSNGFAKLATSSSFTIAPGISISLGATQSNLLAGGPVTANWSGRVPPSLTDWVGLYVSGAANSAFVAWSYTTGTQSGNVTFTIPAGTAPGAYELRLFGNNGFTLIAVSQRLIIS